MTTIDAAPRPARAGQGRLAAFLHPTTSLAVLLCALLAFGAWAMVNRPVEVPGFDGQIAGLAFSPFHRGQSPEDASYPTAARSAPTCCRQRRLTGRIRTYTVQGGLADIPRLAADLPLRITLGGWLDRKADGNAAEIARLIARRAKPSQRRARAGGERDAAARGPHPRAAHRLYPPGEAGGARAGLDRRTVACLARPSRAGAGRSTSSPSTCCPTGKACRSTIRCAS